MLTPCAAEEHRGHWGGWSEQPYRAWGYGGVTVTVLGRPSSLGVSGCQQLHAEHVGACRWQGSPGAPLLPGGDHKPLQQLPPLLELGRFHGMPGGMLGLKHLSKTHSISPDMDSSGTSSATAMVCSHLRHQWERGGRRRAAELLHQLLNPLHLMHGDTRGCPYPTKTHPVPGAGPAWRPGRDGGGGRPGTSSLLRSSRW